MSNPSGSPEKLWNRNYIMLRMLRTVYLLITDKMQEEQAAKKQ